MSLDWSTIAVASCTLLSSVLAFFGIRTISQHDRGIEEVRSEQRSIVSEQGKIDKRLIVLETEHKNSKCGRKRK